MSNHFHLVLGGGTVQDQADLLRDFTRKISIETGRLYGWRETTFPRRYRCTEISDEPEAQIARLSYCLRHGCKENLVASPLDWPGVSFADALLSGEPLRGVWVDRTGYTRARQRGEEVTLADFTEPMELDLAPLPCWAHLDVAVRRDLVLGLIREIEDDTAARHRVDGTAPLGAAAVLAGDPRDRPEAFVSTPKRVVHAFATSVRRAMIEALSLLVAAYRDAAERLRRGELTVAFPGNTFPPARPFVEPDRALSSHVPAQLEPD